jgi:hypothetical protein
MEQSQFYELVCTLSGEERSRFLWYLESEYANNGRFKGQIPQISQLCWEYQSNPSAHTLDKKVIFQQLFPGQQYADGRIEKLLVDAQKTLKTFLLNEFYHREENEFRQSLDFAEIVRKRGLADRHQKMIARLKQNQESTTRRGVGFYFNQLLLEEAILYVEALNNKRKDDINLPNTMKALADYYHIRRLEMLVAYLMQKKVATFEDQPFVQALLEGREIFDYCHKDNLLIQINELVFSILKKNRPDTSDIQQLFAFFQENAEKMALPDLKDLSTHLRNFCSIITTHEPDNIEMLQLFFSIQQNDLERGFMHYEGKIGAGKFRAVAGLAIALKHYDWAEKFIEENKNFIRDDNESQDVFKYVKSYYLFEIGKFDECYDLLPNTSPVNDIQIACKRLELRVLYELQSDLLPYRMDAFKMYLHRTSPKIYSEQIRTTSHQFHLLLQQIIQCPPNNPQKVDRLIQRIKDTRFAADWAWLLQKAEALKLKKQ